MSKIVSFLTVFLLFFSQLGLTQEKESKDDRKLIFKDEYRKYSFQRDLVKTEKNKNYIFAEFPYKIIKVKRKKEQITHFRNSQWGMSKKKANRSEKLKKQAEGQEQLLYKGQVGGLASTISYHFFKGKLVIGFYGFNVRHTSTNKYIEDFETIDTLLKKKYGKPKNRIDRWANSLFKDDSENWGTAISVGHLIKLTVWETESTRIEHILTGDNFEIEHAIKYSSKLLSKEIEKAEEERALDDF